jgi:hypothetical protein
MVIRTIYSAAVPDIRFNMIAECRADDYLPGTLLLARYMAFIKPTETRFFVINTDRFRHTVAAQLRGCKWF